MLGAAVLVAGLSSPSPVVDDWSQWRGPTRDGISDERGVTDAWGASGPTIVWDVPIGQGFSGVSIRDGRLYTLDAPGLTPDGRAAADSTGMSEVVAYDAATGREVWRVPVGAAFIDPRGSGPRSTPLVTPDALYVVGERGRVLALAHDGRELWSRDLVKEFGGEIPMWGYSTSALLVELDASRRVVVVVGGGEGNAVIAFDPDRGETVWSTGDGAAGYASPLEIEVDGERILAALLGDRFSGFSLDGRELWSYPWPVINNLNIASPTPVTSNRLFIGTSYDVGSALLEISKRGDEWDAHEVWRGRAMKQHFHMSVADGGHIYGFDNAIFECVDAATGEIAWRRRGYGKGSLLLADGKLIVLSERGELALVEPSPEAFREIASHRLFEERAWTPPSLSGGQLYVRNESRLMRVDLRAGAQSTDSITVADNAADVLEGSWAGIERFRFEGRMHRNGILLELVVSAHREGRMRMEKRFGDGREIVVFHGERAWRKPRDEEVFTTLTPREAWSYRAEAETYARFPDAFERWPDVTEGELVAFEDETVRRVVTTPPDGPSAEWLFDPATGALVAAKRSYPGYDGTLLTVTMRYSDYRAVPSGQRLAHFVEWDESETFLFTLELSAFEVNPSLSDDLFLPERP